ncbi:MAG: RtcB family protein [Candidatus Omnitrophica bacterium]|nr:RtcB family protein [Candidatus Omnitrophota bacterium]
MSEWGGPLEKIDDYRWRIPKSYNSGMRVPGIIYADENLLKDIRSDRAAEQVANVAHLPGIVKYSLAMPDIHWGYGFCLTKDTKVLTNFGFYKEIEDFQKDWPNQDLRCIDLTSHKPVETSILKFLKLEPKEILKITTKTGYEIKATGDHPLLTPTGMKPIKELSSKMKVAIFPFRGVPYEKPSGKTIISEQDIRRTLLKAGRKPGAPKFDIILQKLKKRNLLALTYDHPKLPYILKIMGFVFGDASMNFIGKREDGVFHFAGKPQDLEKAREDLERIGYTPGPIHFGRVRIYRRNNKLYNRYWFSVNASSLVILLETLGVPRGSKVKQAYRIPRWIFRTPLWQKRLFLASLFGCELRRPHRRLERRGYFNAPVFPMAKREELIKNGKDFLNDISKLLKEFGVKTLYIDKRKRHINTRGEVSWALELLLSPKPENIFNLWGKIGFEYNQQRSFEANIATQYLKFKDNLLKEKKEAIEVVIPRLLKNRLSYQKIALQLAGNPLTKRFVIDVCWKLNKGRKIIPRIPVSFPLLEDYQREVTAGLGQSGMVWDEIRKIEKTSYQDFVYDFTVCHSDHNFIADNFVVSNCIGGVAATDIEAGGVISPGGVGFDINCGVRLARTNLSEQDVQPKIRDLVYALFNNVPSGLGSKGEIHTSVQEEKKLLIKGAQWAVEKGYGFPEDIEYTEERGAIQGADPQTVSSRAYERGQKQAGTLGSGNHFLEIQVIDQIYDEQAAGVFNLHLGQITVMIHSGSRGFGYQICDDYAKGMVRTLSKFGIQVPDRQLACAPVKSPEGQAYLGAMRCAANYAWCNRQVLMELTRRTFQKFFNLGPKDLGLSLVYDVAHNIAKIEKHNIEGKEKRLCVHRKGATRAFAPGHPELPPRYRPVGQPVIIPGDMGRYSFLLVGTEQAAETFFSTCHGSGRRLSRSAAIRKLKGRSIARELEQKGIFVRSAGRDTLAEEAPEAYKNVSDVVNVVHQAGISRRVCRMRPLGVVKG